MSLKNRVIANMKDKIKLSPRVFVIIYRDELTEAIRAGLSILSIYETIIKEYSVKFKYDSFRRQINKLMQRENENKKTIMKKDEPKVYGATKLNTFEYNNKK